MNLVRVKIYLRGIMKQERLNNLMIHKEHTDELVLKQVANDFVSIEWLHCLLVMAAILESKFP